MFRETDFHCEVLIYGDIIVLLQPQFVVPKDGLCERKVPQSQISPEFLIKENFSTVYITPNFFPIILKEKKKRS